MRVTELARACGISRSTVLYYESVGLLKPARRSEPGYRIYDRSELDRLRKICCWRQAGLTLDDIVSLLDRPSTGEDAVAVLTTRLDAIAKDILRLQEHQRAILALLSHPVELRRTEDMTKDKWVGIMRASGFSDDDMHRWHKEFEKAAPEEHAQFLEYLSIPADEAERIREWSRDT